MALVVSNSNLNLMICFFYPKKNLRLDEFTAFVRFFVLCEFNLKHALIGNLQSNTTKISSHEVAIDFGGRNNFC